MMRKSVITGLVGALCCLSMIVVPGCLAHLSVQSDGVTASYTRIGDQEIQGLKAYRDKNGTVNVELESVKSESESTIQALIQALQAAK